MKELLEGTRPIYTNLPLVMDKLREYFIKRKYPLRLLDRIHILEDSQVGRFWRYRPSEVKVNSEVKANAGECTILEFKEDGGVFYLIDEAHLKFRVHDWKELGLEAPFYVSQHGHLDDDVVLITQHVDKLVKALKLDVQLYVEIEYMRRQHWLVFQKGYHFKAKYWTAGIPDNQSTKPNNVEAFFPDKALMKCYDSKAGHGIERISTHHGREGFTGLPPWVSWGVVVLAVYLAVKVLFGGLAYMQKKLGMGNKNKQIATTEGQANQHSEKSLESKGNAALLPKESTEIFKPDGRMQEALMIKGISVREVNGKLRFIIALSDGRSITEEDNLISKIRRSSVTFRNGEIVYMDEKWRGLSEHTRGMIDRAYAEQAGGDDTEILPEKKSDPPNLYGKIDRIHPK